MEEWKSGKMEEWKNVIIRQFDNGRMEEWKNGKMEEWKNVVIRQWKNGRVEPGLLSGLILLFEFCYLNFVI